MAKQEYFEAAFVISAIASSLRVKRSCDESSAHVQDTNLGIPS